MPLGLGALVHLGVLAAAAATLPIAIAQGFGTPPTTAIAPWLIALFAASIGLPFVALAASAPLLQGWFAASGHVQARNPYVLYAASNLGSFAALIAYPFVDRAVPDAAGASRALGGGLRRCWRSWSPSPACWWHGGRASKPATPAPWRRRRPLD